MRRTYRSRKDDGGLDRKDLISVIDAKSSVFDAFYIQNIKQTKRELSCVGNKSKVAFRKVRKRKYVKRIVEDASIIREEPSRDGKSCSVYLTPNKSIHVKRELDPFDLLLISSPAINKSPRSSQRVCETIYGEKKTKKVAEFNYTDNEAIDKENELDLSINDSNKNMTNFKSHKLVIESENINDLNQLEDSITSMVKKMSVLKAINNRSQHKSEDNIHRLTSAKNRKSMGSAKSPVCSTPFQEKYRGKSIYNFSPITMSFCDSPKLFEGNANVRDNCKISNIVEDQNKGINEDSANKTELLFGLNSCHISFKNNFKKHPMEDLQTSQAIDFNSSDSIQTIPVTRKSSFSKSERVPVFGFRESVVTTESKDNESAKTAFDNATLTINKENLRGIDSCYNYSHSTDCFTTVTTSENKTNSSGSSCGKKITDSELLYDTCSVNESIVGTSAPAPLCPVVVLERINDSLFYKYFKKNADEEVANPDAPSNSSINNDSQDNSYCPEISYLTDLKNGSCNTNFAIDIANMDNSIMKENISLNSELEHELHNTADDNEPVSFVTIRRGNAVINKSIIYISDNSNSSVSSSEVDKIVVLNNIDDSSKTYESCTNAEERSVEKTISLSGEYCTLGNDTLKKLDEENLKYFSLCTTVDENYKPNVTTRYNTEGEINVVSKCQADSDAKTPVVLQPGKKWERSLSIYKRMTTMADSLEHSLLDIENTEHKGRKYRQSVIAMMEMQKFHGTLHNESFNGRRSTFVCKPSRSTIKIIKENNYTRTSKCSSTIYEDFKGLVSDDCDDTIVDLSKLSIDDSVREVTVLEKLHDTSRDSTARDFVLRRCDQTDVLLFDECYPDTALKNCHKIGEGVYGEVFLWRARDGRARVLKVIPIAGDVRVNGEPQKGYHEIISEIVIAMELSALRAPVAEIEQRLDEGQDIDPSLLHSVQNATDVFNEVLAVRCVRGRYPARLLELWELYDECRGSDNDCPAALSARQHYLVLELRNAGQDLESYCFNSAEQAHALFLQLALGLAVAEEALQFEHRDLHWGNVLVSPTEQKFATFVVRGRVVRAARRGVACAVIDYSLSRLTLGDAALYTDLAADETLFEAVGDRQFTVYRLMRDRLGNDWKNFEPYTNVLWLEYVADKMITSLRYKRTNTKIHKHYVAKLKAIKNRLLDYGSAAQFVLTDNEF